MRIKFVFFAVLCFSLVLTFHSSSEAELITNGDFATDAFGWIYNNPSDGGYKSAVGNPAGSFWINHNGYSVGSDPDPMLSQVIPTVVGTWYQISFDYSNYVIYGGIGLALDIDGVEKMTYSILAGGWQTTVYQFQATASSTQIAFRSEINGTDYDALIDNVSLDRYTQEQNPVPEPATMMLLGIGLLGLAGVSRRKK